MSVAGHASLINILVVEVNGVASAFAANDVRLLRIDTFGGADVVRIDASLDAMQLPSWIDTGDGADRVFAGAGADTINAGTGNDCVFGGAGNDAISGDPGNDRIDGASGDDTISGGRGNDQLFGNTGEDQIRGNAGDDTIDGGDQADRLLGDDGNDRIDGGKASDSIEGSAGDDQLSDRFGAVYVLGGTGNDAIVVRGAGVGTSIRPADGPGLTFAETIYTVIADGGPGDDTIRAEGDAASIVLGGEGDDDIANPLGSAYGQAGDDRVQANKANGNLGSDLVIGTDADDLVTGGEGNDALYGGNGTDTLYGGAGDDNLYGGGVNDRTRSNDGQDEGTGGDGKDWFDPGHDWAYTDRDRGDSNLQAVVAGDPNLGNAVYLSGSLRSSGSIDSSAGSLTIELWKGGVGTLTPVSPIPTLVGVNDQPLPAVRPIGSALLLAGSYGGSTDNRNIAARATAAPTSLSKSQRLSLRPQIVALPSDWNIARHSTARDGVVWYRVWNQGVGFINEPSHQSQLQFAPGTLLKRTLVGPASYSGSGATLTIAAGQSVEVDLVPASDVIACSYFAVDENSLLLTGKALTTEWRLQSVPVSVSGVVPIPVNTYVQSAREGVARQAVVPSSAVVTVTPPWKSARGVYVAGGAYWLDEASGPFFRNA